MNFENYRLLAPGPVPLAPEVYELLKRPIIHHRTPLFSDILNRVFTNLKPVFGTEQPVLLQASMGSGVMESALVNTHSPQDKVIVVNSGKFGERWMKMARSYDLQVIEHKVAWGKSVDPNDIEKLLKENPDVKSVFCQVCETSTGALHDIKALGKLTQNSDALLIVDGITAVGMLEIPMDSWSIDVLVSGSQKAFMLPPGLGFIAFSERAWKVNQTAKLKRYYFDLEPELKASQTGQTRFTSAISHIVALDWVLESFLNEGLIERFKRIQKLSKAFETGLTTLGFHVFPENPSPSLGVYSCPDTVDGQKVRAHLETKYEVTIAGGQDQLKGKVIRIGHMGHIPFEDVLRLTRDLGRTLGDLGFSSDPEQAVTAVQSFIEA